MKNRIPSLQDRFNKLEASLEKAVIEPVCHPLTESSGVRLFIKREDLLHPIISGNKWRKLKYNIIHAIELGHDRLISMGGPWSNHLHALAYAGKELGVKTTGIIRGEIPEIESDTLRDMRKWGMQLEFVSRSEFRRLRHFRDYDSEPATRYEGYWIPEGGANELALKGIEELVHEIDIPYDTITLACGTGTTLAGIANVLSPGSSILGFAVLKGAGFLYDEINQHIKNRKIDNWDINLVYHFGGFAKTDQKLTSFINEFEDQTEIPLEPVYTGKMMFGLFDLIRKGHFRPGTRAIAIHTGGLQGNRGLINNIEIS